MKRIDTFIPAGPPASRQDLLSRWLPLLPPSLVVEYLRAYSHDDEVIWDPFCRGDDVAGPALRANRRVLVSDYNPLTNFLVQMAVDPVPARDIRTAFQTLSESTRHNISLRDHLMQIYATECPHCRQTVVADYFLWHRKEEQPFKKHYHCPTCQIEHLEPFTDADQRRMQAIEPKGLHYWYILERLAPTSKRTQAMVERLLSLYTPRNLYALVTLLMRIEATVENKRAQDALKVALLRCLLEGSKLTSGRGRSLRVPNQFQEVNVWLCFEAAVQDLCVATEARPPVLVTRDVETLLARDATLWDYSASRRARVLIARRTPRQMARDLPPASIDLILTRPPYPDRPFLSLCYLWTGWLLGAGPAATLARLLDQGPFEGWARTLPALRKTFHAMCQALKPAHAMILLFTTADADYLTSLVMTAVAAGFYLDTLLFQRGPVTGRRTPTLGGEYRLTFLRSSDGKPSEGTGKLMLTPDHLATTLQTAAARAARQGLQERGEPMGNDWLQAAILTQLAAADEHVLRDVFVLADSLAGFDALRFVNEQIAAGLRQAVTRGVLVTLSPDRVTLSPDRVTLSPDRVMLSPDRVTLSPDRVTLSPDVGPAPSPTADTLAAADHDEDEEEEPGAAATPEPGERLWWLARPTFKPRPLSERVEQTVYNVLATSQATTEAAVERVIASLYRGLLTPAPHWVAACLASYGRREANGTWSLRVDDDRRLRAREHTEMLALLTDLGHRLGFHVWIGRSEQKRKLEAGFALVDRLSPRERYIDPGSLEGGGRYAAEVDILWYEAGRIYCAFEVEWTAQLTEPVLIRGADRRGHRSYIVLPAPRVDLVEQRIHEAPLLRQALADGAWGFIKYEHLRTWAAQETIELGELDQIVGLAPPIESGGIQLTLF